MAEDPGGAGELTDGRSLRAPMPKADAARPTVFLQFEAAQHDWPGNAGIAMIWNMRILFVLTQGEPCRSPAI